MAARKKSQSFLRPWMSAAHRWYVTLRHLLSAITSQISTSSSTTSRSVISRGLCPSARSRRQTTSKAKQASSPPPSEKRTNSPAPSSYRLARCFGPMSTPGWVIHGPSAITEPRAYGGSAITRYSRALARPACSRFDGGSPRSYQPDGASTHARNDHARPRRRPRRRA